MVCLISCVKVSSILPNKTKEQSITILCRDNGIPSLALEQRFNVVMEKFPDLPKNLVYNGNTNITENNGALKLGMLVVVNMVDGTPIPGVSIQYYTLLEGQSMDQSSGINSKRNLGSCKFNIF